MIDWNYVLSQIATVAFDILYFGAIIGTIVIIILDNRNPVKTMAYAPNQSNRLAEARRMPLMAKANVPMKSSI